MSANRLPPGERPTLRMARPFHAPGRTSGPRALRGALPTLLLAACAGASASPRSGTLDLAPTPLGAPREQDERVEQVAEATRAGDYERARVLLDALLVDDCITRARAALAAGDPRSALEPADRALELAAQDPRVLLLRGEVAFATAPTDSQPQFFYEEAVSYYERALRASLAGRTPARGASGNALLSDEEVRMVAELSRARLRVPDVSGARAVARSLTVARQDREAAGLGWPELGTPLERLLAEAGFQAFLERRNAGLDTTADYLETEDMLAATAGHDAHRAWALGELANLYLWGGDRAAAVEQLQRLLELTPEDPAVHDRLVQQLDAGPEGRDSAIAFYEGFRARHPESPLGWWYGGVETFYRTLERFEAEQRDADGFRAAEDLFRRCRELQPDYAESCTGYEAVCRSGRAWCRYHEGDLEAAEQAFLSMEEVRPGGLRVGLEGRLTDGVTGLGFLIAKWIEDPRDVEANLHAARVGDLLHAYDPRDGNLANNAGFLNRDAAVMLETRSRMARSRAARLDPGTERDDLLASAESDLAQALEVMGRSWNAYLVAAELLPEDVRVVNDAGLVMTYYLRTDPDAAERLLRQAAENGEAQLATTTLEGAELFQLREAWGDANQNLGVLYLTLRDDLKTARAFFERSLEAGTPSREWVRAELLPLLDRGLAGETLAPGDYPRALQYWAHQPARD